MQDTSKDDWESQLTDYTFGTMDAEAAARFEQGLIECREHVALAQQFSEVAAWLSRSVPSVEPPEGHKARLMASITSLPQSLGSSEPTSDDYTLTSTRPLVSESQIKEPAPEKVVDLGSYREKRRVPAFLPALAAAAAMLVLFIGLWGWMSSQQVQGPFPPGTIAFAVEGQGQVKASAVALVNPDTNKASLLANGLTPLPAGKVYELWLLPSAPDRKPVAAGLINVRNDGSARHEVTAPSNFRDFVGVAVTIEDAPGVQESTQAPILVGTYDTQ